MAEGFFTAEETKGVVERGCASCGLYRGCQTPRMKPHGDGERGWMCVGEAPGEEEDNPENARPFVGKSGQLWRRKLRDSGVRLDRDFVTTNACVCRPPGNRTPTSAEIAICRTRLFEAVRQAKPKAVFLMGLTAIEAWWGGRLGEAVGAMGKWRGLRIPDREHDCWVFHLFHPSYVSRSEHYQPAVEVVFDADVAYALAHADDPMLPHMSDEVHVEILEDRREIVRRLRAIPRGSLLAHDYETTGKKPWNKGHDIRIVAWSLGQGVSTSVPMEDPVVRREWRRTIERPDLYLSAHQLQFEDMWARCRLGAVPANWAWDSMLAAHALDNRRDITSLEWQAFQNYGAIGFKTETDAWLKTRGGSTHSFNQLTKRMKHQDSRRKLLLRCGLDALYGGRLSMDQMHAIGTFPWDR